MSNAISRYPSWIRDALGLQEGDLPSRLASGVIDLSLDPYQGGWGVQSAEDDWLSTRVQIAASTPQGDFPILPASDDHGYLVTQVSSLRGGAGAASVDIRAVDPVPDRSHSLAIFDGTSNRGWAFISQGAPWFLVPPTWALEGNHSGTGVGDTLDIRVCALRFRRGFKPI